MSACVNNRADKRKCDVSVLATPGYAFTDALWINASAKKCVNEWDTWLMKVGGQISGHSSGDIRVLAGRQSGLVCRFRLNPGVCGSKQSKETELESDSLEDKKTREGASL